MPTETDSLMAQASRAYQQGRLEEAVGFAKQILALDPDHLDAALLIGIGSARMDRPQEAIAALSTLAERGCQVYLVYYWLASAHRRLGQLPQALACAQKAVELGPNEAQGYHQLGLCHLENQNWEAAARELKKAARIAPRVASTQASLGCALEELGRASEARQAYLQAVALNPGHIVALGQLGLMHIHQLDYDGAMGYARRILQADPSSVRGHALMAAVLIGLNKAKEAKSHAEQVLTQQPDLADSLTLYGTMLQAIGQLDEAERYFRMSIEKDPKQGYPYYGLVRAKRVTATDAEMVQQMERVLADEALPRVFRRDLEFAAGKAYSDLGKPQQSMSHYNQGNSLLREMRFGKAEFDRNHFKQGVDFVVKHFHAKFIQESVAHGSPERLPIFVVGMMRSGTTLAEQILSSHPEVAGAGERRFWMEHRRTVLNAAGTGVDPKRMADTCAAYLRELREFGPDATRVVDKLPTNYGHVGLLHAAFPQAAIIHMRRHPVDTCLSIWMTLNSASVEWACVKRNIVFVYRQYLRVMEHWRQVLPPGTMLEVQYEDLVANPEPTIREMVAHCGLEWNDRCLQHQDNQRAIATPSDWQVRQPIYRSSVERWRAFEPYLEEFAELLSEG